MQIQIGGRKELINSAANNLAHKLPTMCSSWILIYMGWGLRMATIFFDKFVEVTDISKGEFEGELE